MTRPRKPAGPQAPLPEIQTLWQTAKVRCELVVGRAFDSRVLLWVGGRLMFEQLVASYPDAWRLAADLKDAYNYLG